MKKQSIALGLTLLFSANLVGCKSTSQMAWWKKDKGADATVTAGAAPALPSDVAKQKEQLAAADNDAGGGEAAPFVPPQFNDALAAQMTAAATPTTYPSTGAPGYSSTQVAAATTPSTQQQPNSANLGSVALPYNPNVMPGGTAAPTTSVADAPAAAAGNAYDQYAAAPAAAVQQSVQSSYNNAANKVADQLNSASEAVAATTTPAASPTSNSGYDRYASSPTPPTTPATSTPAYRATPSGSSSPYSSPAASSATSVATTPASYRPAGTGSYPGAMQVATRPETTEAASNSQAEPTTTDRYGPPSTGSSQPASRY